jgi:hypothetical protein
MNQNELDDYHVEPICSGVYTVEDHQVKVAKGEVSHTKKYGTFNAGPVLEVLLRKWFPVGAVIDQTARRVRLDLLQERCKKLNNDHPNRMWECSQAHFSLVCNEHLDPDQRFLQLAQTQDKCLNRPGCATGLATMRNSRNEMFGVALARRTYPRSSKARGCTITQRSATKWVAVFFAAWGCIII